jgi:hypothetical protein
VTVNERHDRRAKSKAASTSDGNEEPDSIPRVINIRKLRGIRLILPHRPVQQRWAPA